MCALPNGKRCSEQSLAAGAVAAINSLNPPAYKLMSVSGRQR